MAEKSKNTTCREEKPAHETCAYVQAVGQLATYVSPGCPRAEMLKGHLVSSKWRCKECPSWKPKG